MTAAPTAHARARRAAPGGSLPTSAAPGGASISERELTKAVCVINSGRPRYNMTRETVQSTRTGPIRPTGLRCSTNVRAPSRTASARVVAKVEVPVPRGVAQITSAAPAVTPTAAASPSGGPVCMRGVEGARCGRGVRPDEGDSDGIVPSSTHCERPAKQTGGEHVRVARDGGPCEGAREPSARSLADLLLRLWTSK